MFPTNHNLLLIVSFLYSLSHLVLLFCHFDQKEEKFVSFNIWAWCYSKKGSAVMKHVSFKGVTLFLVFTRYRCGQTGSHPKCKAGVRIGCLAMRFWYYKFKQEILSV